MIHFKRGAAAKAYLEKTVDALRFKYDPYLAVTELIKAHRELTYGENPSENRWITHLEKELMPFWMKPEVKDMSKGLFRSFFTDDGKPLPGLDNVAEWPKAFQEAIKKIQTATTKKKQGRCWRGTIKMRTTTLFGRIPARHLHMALPTT